MSPTHTHRLLAALVSGLILMSCGASTQVMQSGGNVRVASPETAYRVGEPSGSWQRLQAAGDNDIAFSSGSSIAQINSSCDPALDIPLVALRNHLLIGFTEREHQSEELVPFSGREALRSVVLAKLDGVPRELHLVVLKKDGCVYDFAVVAPPGRGDSSRTMDELLAGFRTEAPE